MSPAEIRGGGNPEAEAQRRCLGLQTPGGRHPVHLQCLSVASLPVSSDRRYRILTFS